MSLRVFLGAEKAGGLRSAALSHRDAERLDDHLERKGDAHGAHGGSPEVGNVEGRDRVVERRHEHGEHGGDPEPHDEAGDGSRRHALERPVRRVSGGPGRALGLVVRRGFHAWVFVRALLQCSFKNNASVRSQETLLTVRRRTDRIRSFSTTNALWRSTPHSCIVKSMMTANTYPQLRAGFRRWWRRLNIKRVPGTVLP